MKLNYFTKRLQTIGRGLVCLVAIAFVWLGAFANTAALANPTLIAADMGDKVQQKTDETAGQSKGFIRDAADKVKEAAKSNASKVDEATDEGSPIERKAKRDAARIQKRADEDASRTQKAVDDNLGAVKGAVEKIKDVFRD